MSFVLIIERGGGKIRKNRAMDTEGQGHRDTDKDTLVNLIPRVMR